MPADLLRLIQLGYGDKIVTISALSSDYRMVHVLALAFASASGELWAVDDPSEIEEGLACALFDRGTGLCRVHRAKPLEGKVACCIQGPSDGLALRDEIVRSWDTAAGRRLTSSWMMRHGQSGPKSEVELRARATEFVTKFLMTKGE